MTKSKSREQRAESKEPRAKDREPSSSELYALRSVPPEFLAIGHFTHDVTASGLILGGAAAYSSITARGLGLSAGVISSVGEDFFHYDKLDGISLSFAGSVEDGLTTTFANIYEGGIRRQILKSVSSPICPEHVPSEWLDAEIVYICPVANEVDPSIVHKFPNSLIGVSPQGWMRQWDGDGRVSPRKWEDARNILPYVDVVVMSEEDVLPFPEIVREYIDLAEVVVLTRGEKGSTLFHDSQVADFPACPMRAVDPTGAGDVFAAAFLIEFHRTQDLHRASVFANCVASFVVEKQGTEGIPDLARVRARLIPSP